MITAYLALNSCFPARSFPLFYEKTSHKLTLKFRSIKTLRFFFFFMRFNRTLYFNQLRKENCFQLPSLKSQLFYYYYCQRVLRKYFKLRNVPLTRLLKGLKKKKKKLLSFVHGLGSLKTKTSCPARGHMRGPAAFEASSRFF